MIVAEDTRARAACWPRMRRAGRARTSAAVPVVLRRQRGGARRRARRAAARRGAQRGADARRRGRRGVGPGLPGGRRGDRGRARAWCRCPGRRRLLAALVAAGLPTDRFLFLGFPPRKPGARRRLFDELRPLPYTLMFYESPLRAAATLADLAAALGRRAARLRRARADQAARGARARRAGRAGRALRRGPPLGEVTLVVAGADERRRRATLTDEDLDERAAELLAEGRRRATSPTSWRRSAAARGARSTGWSASEARRSAAEEGRQPLPRSLEHHRAFEEEATRSACPRPGSGARGCR